MPLALNTISVYLHAPDPITLAGVAGQLRPLPDVDVVGADRLDGAHVAVLVVDRIDEAAVRTITSLRGAGPRGLVVVATELDDAGLALAVGAEVSALIRRSEATAEQLSYAIAAAARGEACVPPDLLGRLLSQVGRLQRQVLGPRGLTLAGLTERETAVLRLVADGYDTDEIAVELNYSPRTVKGVLSAITNRFKLRNRSHAVAYALRHGLI